MPYLLLVLLIIVGPLGVGWRPMDGRTDTTVAAACNGITNHANAHSRRAIFNFELCTPLIKYAVFLSNHMITIRILLMYTWYYFKDSGQEGPFCFDIDTTTLLTFPPAERYVSGTIPASLSGKATCIHACRYV